MALTIRHFCKSTLVSLSQRNIAINSNSNLFNRTFCDDKTSASKTNPNIEDIKLNESEMNNPDAKITIENSEESNLQEDDKLGGFAKFFDKYTSLEELNPKKPEKPIEIKPFISMLRGSKLMQLGNPKGRIVTGTIVREVQDDLYIDFGMKHHCVCSRPQVNGDKYTRGAKVILRLIALENTQRFLGSETDISLREASAVILRLHNVPGKQGSRPFAEKDLKNLDILVDKQAESAENR